MGVICLGVESTAHTFGVSIVSTRRGEPKILSDIREVYVPEPGKGIHPRESSRHHARVAASTVKRALKEAEVDMGEVDAIAFSLGPGLGPCLRVGAVVARSISAYYAKPLIPVNHAVAHIELAAMLTGARDPLAVLVSGGHTVITAFSAGRWRVLGETLDLTLGQLVDQFGREAGYASPFGVNFEKLAQRSRNYIELPYTVKGNDVSFSGIITAAKKLLHRGERLEDLCFSIQETSFAMLAEAVERALAFTEKDELLLTGGVAANRRLQEMLEDVCSIHRARFLSVPREYSGDCGAQIAWNGLQAFEAGVSIDILKSGVRQAWRLDEVDARWRCS